MFQVKKMSDQKITTGSFYWIDFATPNPEKMKIFYQRVFNWQYSDNPMPDGSVYIMISAADGGSVGGLFRMPEEMRKAQVPPHINNYIAVESMDKVVENAKNLGATIKAEPFDVFDYGRMAVLIDPTGATFSLWQTKSTDDEEIMAKRETHGMFCWQELMTTNVDQAANFYKKLFGWNLQKLDAKSMKYTVIKNQKTDIGGMTMLMPEMKDLPSHWSTYFTTTNLDETVRIIKDNGGNIMTGPQDIPETGKFAICQAPDGTVFCLFQYTSSKKAA